MVLCQCLLWEELATPLNSVGVEIAYVEPVVCTTQPGLAIAGAVSWRV